MEQVRHFFGLKKDPFPQDVAIRDLFPLPALEPLIIDEAHLFKSAVFNQFHTLLQFEYDSKPVMSVILCGQERLLDHLMANAARPLASRVLGRNHPEAIERTLWNSI